LGHPGKSQGLSGGTHGRSYAICTILRPGAKRSVSLDDIRRQVLELYEFARQHPEMTFIVTQSGQPGKPSLNGYSLDENASCYLAKL
jgi:hypothetical protein